MTNQFNELLRQVARSFSDIDTAFGFVFELRDHTDDLVAALIEALEDDDHAVQAAAAFSLGHLWYVLWPDEIDASSSISTLLTLIDDDDPRVVFESTRAVAVLQVGELGRLTEEQIMESYLWCVEYGDRSLMVKAASQVLAIEPEAINELCTLLDATVLQEVVEDARQRPVRRRLE